MLERHGPLHPEDSIIRDELEAFPAVAQMLILQAGGINKFLSQSLKFNIVDGLVCLLRDIARAKKLASDRRRELLHAKKAASSAGGAAKIASADKTVSSPKLHLSKSVSRRQSIDRLLLNLVLVLGCSKFNKVSMSNDVIQGTFCNLFIFYSIYFFKLKQFVLL